MPASQLYEVCMQDASPALQSIMTKLLSQFAQDYSLKEELDIRVQVVRKSKHAQETKPADVITLDAKPKEVVQVQLGSNNQIKQKSVDPVKVQVEKQIEVVSVENVEPVKVQEEKKVEAISIKSAEPVRVQEKKKVELVSVEKVEPVKVQEKKSVEPVKVQEKKNVEAVRVENPQQKKKRRVSEFFGKVQSKAQDRAGYGNGWKLIKSQQSKSEVPTPRCGATSVYHAKTNTAYLVGGLGDEGFLSDSWKLNPSTWEWSKVQASGLKERAWHTAAVVNDRLLVFGGQCDKPVEKREDEEDETELLSDFAIFDFESGVWFDSYSTGESPSARSGHSASTVEGPDGKSLLVVFGGLNDDGKYLNDVHVLDTVLFNWYKPKTKGSPMKARAYHTAVVVNHKIIFFGGVGRCNWAFKEIYSLDTRTWKWTEHSSFVQGECPTNRVGQIASLLPDGKSILVQGGHDPDDPSVCYDDASILDTSIWSWVKPPTCYVKPTPRAGHCFIQVGDTLATFTGQQSSGAKVEDMWLLDLNKLTN